MTTSAAGTLLAFFFSYDGCIVDGKTLVHMIDNCLLAEVFSIISYSVQDTKYSRSNYPLTRLNPKELRVNGEEIPGD